LPEDFWLFSEHWSPRFEGIQPYLLQGMLAADTESNALNLIHTLMKVVWDPVVDSSHIRHLTTVMSLLPWLYIQIKNEQARVRVREILADLAGVIGRFSKDLAATFRTFADKDTSSDEFIKQVCAQLAAAYFPQYAQAAAEYLTALLQSDFTVYHAVVFKITNQFLLQDSAMEYVKAFDEIVSMAHEAVTKIVGADAADVTTRVAKRSSAVTVTERQSTITGPKPGEAGKVSAYDFEIAGPAADVVATVISLFNKSSNSKNLKKGAHRRNDPRSGMHSMAFHGLEKSALERLSTVAPLSPDDARTRASTAAFNFSNVNVRALPIRSLRSAINALQQVVRSSPMFPKREF
jgi:hypothetical protein